MFHINAYQWVAIKHIPVMIAFSDLFTLLDRTQILEERFFGGGFAAIRATFDENVGHCLNMWVKNALHMKWDICIVYLCHWVFVITVHHLNHFKGMNNSNIKCIIVSLMNQRVAC